MGYIEVKCLVCGKSKRHHSSRVEAGYGKYCSKECSDIGQKGYKRPHTKEWEEKRVKAIRDNTHKWKGKPRPKSKETIKKALAAKRDAVINDPQKYSKIAIDNLPKDINGENNPNFRNWATKRSESFRIQNSDKFRKWRKAVLEKWGNKCRLCGTTEGKIDAHHIIELSKTIKPAFEVWNGVPLCRKCHVKTDSYGGKSKKIETFGVDNSHFCILIVTIPHMFQEYETVGNYKWIDNETYILVSETGNEAYNRLIAIHELIEETLVRHRGMKEEEILNFDLYHQKRVEQGLVHPESEPGFDPNSPYKDEHAIATGVEMILCAKMGISWSDYEKTINLLEYERP